MTGVAASHAGFFVSITAINRRENRITTDKNKPFQAKDILEGAKRILLLSL
ncbi:MAG: hypothetical protein HZC44_13600 [Geobacter sp.]|nr:hypothetical protein [Geobacter sp.]